MATSMGTTTNQPGTTAEGGASPMGSTVEDDMIRVILWCVPRTTSTSLLKCLTYVPDSQVWFEPFLMGYFYSTYGPHRNGMIQFLQEMWGAERNAEPSEFAKEIEGGYYAGDKPYTWVKEQLEGSPAGKKVIFSKDMCWAVDGHYEDLPRGYQHTFLIRHPYRVFDSWKRVTNRGIKDESKKMKITDHKEFLMPSGYFYKEQYDLYAHVKENIDSDPIVIDIDDLLSDPERVLKAYCGATGIPFSVDLLQWKTGRECLDNLWMVAKEQILVQNVGDPHKETFASTCFGSPSKCPDRSLLSDDVLYCADRCIGYYENLYEHRLKC